MSETAVRPFDGHNPRKVPRVRRAQTTRFVVADQKGYLTTFQVSSPGDVDEFEADFLVRRGIAPLYGGAQNPSGYPADYYAVYFEVPGTRAKVEVLFEGVS